MKMRRTIWIWFPMALLAWTYIAWILLKTAFPLEMGPGFFEHAHCIKSLGLQLRTYATENAKVYPVHTNGYADALLLLAEEGTPVHNLTGPGYSPEVFRRALLSGEDTLEQECGRVYIQGLSEEYPPELCMVFDKLPNPGDHTHFLKRLWVQPRREVIMGDGSMTFVLERDWP